MKKNYRKEKINEKVPIYEEKKNNIRNSVDKTK